MSEQPPGEDERAQGSVFGNLPGSRPGPRSPRRDKDKAQRSSGGRRKAASRASQPGGAGPARAPAGKGRATAAKARATAGEARPRAQPRPEPGRARPEAEPESGGGLEEIAWAGVAAAAEAATLGVRLANRALEALRGNSEKG